MGRTDRKGEGGGREGGEDSKGAVDEFEGGNKAGERTDRNGAENGEADVEGVIGHARLTTMSR